MSMCEFERASELIDRNTEEADFAGPLSEEVIAKAEAALGLKFPPTYRLFLRRFGAGDIAGLEVYGITGDNFDSGTVPNGIWLTLRTQNESMILPGFIIIGDTGDGNYYVIDTCEENSDGDCPVKEWVPGESNAPGQSMRVADDFGSFLLNELIAALE